MNNMLVSTQESVYLTDQELIEKFDNRIKNTTFEKRTGHYFKDSALLHAKGVEYQSLSKDKDALDGYAQAYRNKSAKKRKAAAQDAAKCFEEAASLQDKEPSDAKGFALYKYREKVLRLRMEGMDCAAGVKSKSDEDETYRILKSRLSCLSILMDQLENLCKGASEKDEESFACEKKKLEKELNRVKNKLRKKIPSAQSKWQHENNINGDNFFTTGLELLNRENNLLNKTDKNIKDEGRGLYFVIKRDAKGNPVDSVELKKADWNEKLRRAILDKDEAAKAALMIEGMDRLENAFLPAPEDIKKNGVMHYLKKDNTGVLELINYGRYGLYSVMNNEAALEYGDRRGDLFAKLRAAHALGDIFDKEMKGKNYSVEEYKKKYDLCYKKFF